MKRVSAVLGGVSRGRRTAAGGALAVALALGGAACGSESGESGGSGGGGSTSAPGGTLPVGILVPFTGEYAFIGESVQPVAETIVKEVNDSGGIGGRKLSAVQGDTEGTVDAGVLAARKLINTDRARVLIGPTSLEFGGVGRVVTDSKVPFVSPTAGTVELDDAQKNLFYRTVPSDSLGGRAIARAVTDPNLTGRDAPFARPALMIGQAAALVSFEEPIKSGIAEFGGKLASNTKYSTGKESYRSEVQAVLKGDPDVIVLVGEPADSARIMQDAFQAGYEGTWFVTQDQTNADYVKLAGPKLVEGVLGLTETVPPSAGDLLATFTKRLGQEPKIFQTNTYDAVNVAALAMVAADKAGEKITGPAVDKQLDTVANAQQGDLVVSNFTDGKKALESGKGIDYQGLSGPVDFDEYGNIISPFTIQQVKDGKFSDVATVDAAALR